MSRSKHTHFGTGRTEVGTSRTRALKRALMLSTVILLPHQAFGEIGTVAAVNRDLDGTPPQAARRSLALGNGVVREELIQTSPIGSGQLMFMDQTTLTVAPNSDIVLDQYVYDPDKQTGEIAISLTKGALRFIGGRISKNRDAVVRTPTATIGIRGGLTVIQVGDDGETNVIHMAGEYSSVTDSGGKKVTLARPNASASSSEGGGVEYGGIVDAEGLEQVYTSFEGAGDGGSDSLTPIETSNAAGGGNTSGGQSEGDLNTFLDQQLGDLADQNSESEGASEAEPVSTSGESPPAQVEEQVVVVADTNQVNDSGSGSGSGDEDLEETVNTSTGGSVDTGGNTDTGGGGGGVVPPTDPVQTNLTGGFGSGPTGVITFDQVEQGSLIGTAGSEVITIPVPESTADFTNATGANTGFTSFTTGDSTTLGALSGTAFSDLSQDFHFIAVKNAQNVPGSVLFGNPTPGQNAFVEDTALLNPLNNVVESYIFGPDLDDPTGDQGGEELRIINNSGEDRFPNPANNGTTTAGATRVLAADFEVIDTGNGQTETRFFVFADAVFQDSGGEGLRFGTTALGIDGSGNTVSINEESVGTFEDADGNTLFGDQGQYIGLTSAARPGEGLPFNPSNTGVTRGLNEAGGTSTEFTIVAERDAQSLTTVTNPLSLASSSNNAVTQSTGAAQLEGFASGIALCAGAECGRDRDQPADGAGNQTYGLRGTAEVSFNDGNANSVDDNSVNMLFSLNTDGTAFSTGLNNGGLNLLSSSGPQATNAYISDKEFGGLFLTGTPSAGSITGGNSTLNGGFGFASLPLVVDPQELGINTDPTFLRWGTWNAVYDLGLREDAVTGGFFVLGAPTDTSLLPFEGLAEFSGETLGTRTDPAGNRRVVTGDFDLAYDFAAAQGSVNLSIAEFSFNGVDVFEGNALDEYQFQDTSGDLRFIEGRFFDGDGTGFAATAGNFGIVSDATGVQVEGVFGAEQPSFDSSGSLFYGAAPTGSFFATDTGFLPFDETAESSDTREGTSFGGSVSETVTVTVPSSSADFTETTGTNEGFFAFGNELALGSPTGFAQGSSTTLGALDGFGFSDLDENFHAYFVQSQTGQSPGGQTTGGQTTGGQTTGGSISQLIAIGQSTGGQFVFGVANDTQAALPTVTSSSIPEGNILTPLDIGQNLVDGGGAPSSRAFLVSNTGEARFDHSSHTLPANGGRIGTATFTSGPNINGDLSQELNIVAGQLFNDGTGGLRFGAPGFRTNTRNIFVPTATSFNVGVVEDINGDTVFGSTDLRFVVSSVSREDPQSDFTFTAPQNTNLDNVQAEEPGLLSVVEIQENDSVVVSQPFANALNPNSAVVAASGSAALPILTGFATARVECQNNSCGEARPSGGGLTGSYLLSGTANFTFDGNNQTTDDSNGVLAVFTLESDELDNSVPGSNGSPQSYSFATTGGTVFAADDRTFAGTGTGENGGVVTSGNDNNLAQFGFASAELIQRSGTGQVDPLQDAGLLRSSVDEPDFLSWGLWNASFEQGDATNNGVQRRDIISTGLFVAGAPVDPSQIPSTGIAQYDGIAVAQRQDLNLNAVQTVGGTSQVIYNFGTDDGLLAITLDQVANPGVPEVEISGVNISVADGPGTFSGFQTGNIEVQAAGQFFSAPTDPVGATGGDFQISDTVNNIRYDGIFAADRSN